jgi:D-lactate dehydrogenase (cytochrome)
MLYNDQERARAEHVVHDMVKRAIEMEGTVTVSGSHAR